MTWTEFKELVETNGVKDNTELDYIDVAFTHGYEITVSVRDDNTCAILD